MKKPQLIARYAVLEVTHEAGVMHEATFLAVSAPLENDERTRRDPWCGSSCILKHVFRGILDLLYRGVGR